MRFHERYEDAVVRNNDGLDSEGYPEREQIIQQDEVTNLVILLNTAESFEEFLARM